MSFCRNKPSSQGIPKHDRSTSTSSVKRSEYPSDRTYYPRPRANDKHKVLDETVLATTRPPNPMSPDVMMEIWRHLPSIVMERYLVQFCFGLYKDDMPYAHWITNELTWIFRRVFVVKSNPPRLTVDDEKRLRRSFETMHALFNHGFVAKNVRSEKEWFNEIGLASSIRSTTDKSSGDHRRSALASLHDAAALRLHARDRADQIDGFCHGLYYYWMYMENRVAAMRKWGVTTLRLAIDDRRRVLQVIETRRGRTEGGSNRVAQLQRRPTYLELLYDEVGKDAFEKIMFGKRKKCANPACEVTNRDARLLACKKCDLEGIRPRSRYCSKECQKGDWPEHRGKFHSG